MSTFAEWKKRAKIDTWLKDNNEAMRARELAFKAGERQGRKDAEEIARRAIELRALLDSRK